MYQKEVEPTILENRQDRALKKRPSPPGKAGRIKTEVVPFGLRETGRTSSSSINQEMFSITSEVGGTKRVDFASGSEEIPKKPWYFHRV